MYFAACWVVASIRPRSYLTVLLTAKSPHTSKINKLDLYPQTVDPEGKLAHPSISKSMEKSTPAAIYNYPKWWQNLSQLKSTLMTGGPLKLISSKSFNIGMLHVSTSSLPLLHWKDKRFALLTVITDNLCSRKLYLLVLTSTSLDFISPLPHWPSEFSPDART